MAAAPRHPEPAAAGEGSAFFRRSCCLPLIFFLVAASVPGASRHFSTPTPLASGSTLIVGFIDASAERRAAALAPAQLAARLRALTLPGVYIETAEANQRGAALKFIAAATGRDTRGRCLPAGCRDVHILLYGDGAGAAAVLKLSHELLSLNVAVALAELVDNAGSVGVVPQNVARAANFYQRDSVLLHKRTPIHAEDPSKTQILANLRLTPEGTWTESVDERVKKNGAHDAAIESDPQVWNRVEDYILEELQREKVPGSPAPPPHHR